MVVSCDRRFPADDTLTVREAGRSQEDLWALCR